MRESLQQNQLKVEECAEELDAVENSIGRTEDKVMRCLLFCDSVLCDHSNLRLNCHYATIASVYERGGESHTEHAASSATAGVAGE